VSRNVQDPAVIKDVAAYLGARASDEDVASLDSPAIEVPKVEAAEAGEADINREVAEYLGGGR
jgi:hypothetical protein